GGDLAMGHVAGQAAAPEMDRSIHDAHHASPSLSRATARSGLDNSNPRWRCPPLTLPGHPRSSPAPAHRGLRRLLAALVTLERARRHSTTFARALTVRERERERPEELSMLDAIRRSLASHVLVAGAAAGLSALVTWQGAAPVTPSAAQPAAPGVQQIVSQPLADLPGREVRMILIERAPSAASAPHRHPGHHTFGYVM